MNHETATRLEALAQTRLWELVTATQALCDNETPERWATVYRAVAAVPDRATLPRRHEWTGSRVGHGEAQCRFCVITNREAMAIAPTFCNCTTI